MCAFIRMLVKPLQSLLSLSPQERTKDVHMLRVTKAGGVYGHVLRVSVLASDSLFRTCSRC